MGEAPLGVDEDSAAPEVAPFEAEEDEDCEAGDEVVAPPEEALDELEVEAEPDDVIWAVPEPDEALQSTDQRLTLS